MKLETFASQQPLLRMKIREFLDVFNDHIAICILPEREKRRYVSWKEFAKKKRQQKENVS